MDYTYTAETRTKIVRALEAAAKAKNQREDGEAQLLALMALQAIDKEEL